MQSEPFELPVDCTAHLGFRTQPARVVEAKNREAVWHHRGWLAAGALPAGDGRYLLFLYSM